MTSVGVVPTRFSASVPGLKVVMEGKPAAEARDVALDEMQEVDYIKAYYHAQFN